MSESIPNTPRDELIPRNSWKTENRQHFFKIWYEIFVLYSIVLKLFNITFVCLEFHFCLLGTLGGGREIQKEERERMKISLSRSVGRT